jgi:hypothetical protein
MEPEDIPVHDLLGVGSEPAPGPDELRAIVTRAGRKRWGTAAGAATLALGLGLGVGFAVSGNSSPATQTATGAAAANQTSGGAGAPNLATGSSSSGSGSTSSATAPVWAAPHLNKLFTRTAGDVTIRGFLVNFPQISGVPASCGVQGAHLQVEVSSANMVGVVGTGPMGVDRSQPASAIWAEVVGTAEGAPTAVVTAATGPSVAQVSMSFAGKSTDQMAPVQGWVALAAPVSSTLTSGLTLGTLTERQADGTVVASQTVHLGMQPGAALTAPCNPIYPCVQPQTGSASGRGTSTNGTPMPARACPPLACPPVPGASAAAPSVTTVNPAGPAIASNAEGAAGYACVLHPPGVSRGSSGPSGSQP